MLGGNLRLLAADGAPQERPLRTRRPPGSTVASSRGRPTIWSPTRRPSTNPHGTVAAGWPVRLNGYVNEGNRPGSWSFVLQLPQVLFVARGECHAGQGWCQEYVVVRHEFTPGTVVHITGAVGRGDIDAAELPGPLDLGEQARIKPVTHYVEVVGKDRRQSSGPHRIDIIGHGSAKSGWSSSSVQPSSVANRRAASSTTTSTAGSIAA